MQSTSAESSAHPNNVLAHLRIAALITGRCARCRTMVAATFVAALAIGTSLARSSRLSSWTGWSCITGLKKRLEWTFCFYANLQLQPVQRRHRFRHFLALLAAMVVRGVLQIIGNVWISEEGNYSPAGPGGPGWPGTC